MSGITPYRTLLDIARAAPGLSRRAEIEARWTSRNICSR